LSEAATVVVKTIETKNGMSDAGREFTQYKLVDQNDNLYSCFKHAIIKPIEKLTIGEKADITWEQDGRFKNLLSAEPHLGSVPTSYSTQTPTGEADWDRIALSKTRCVLWEAFLNGNFAAHLYANTKMDNDRAGPDDPTIDPVDFVKIIGTALVVHAERDIFTRRAGDDGVPF